MYVCRESPKLVVYECTSLFYQTRLVRAKAEQYRARSSGHISYEKPIYSTLFSSDVKMTTNDDITQPLSLSSSFTHQISNLAAYLPEIPCHTPMIPGNCLLAQFTRSRLTDVLILWAFTRYIQIHLHFAEICSLFQESV